MRTIVILLALLFPVGVQAVQPKVEGAGAFTAAMDTSGTVWVWGSNENAGRGARDSGFKVCSPVTMTNDAIDFAVGEFHTVVVYANGTVVGVGLNDKGQLGDGTTNKQLYPSKAVISNVVNVAAGADHTLFLLNNGELYATGSSLQGEVGDTKDHHIPISIMDNVVLMDAGGHHSLALTSDGTLWAWGSNSFGQLGREEMVYTGMPMLVPGLDGNITAIACGDASSYVVMDGELWAWGYNSDGRLALNDTVNRYAPTKVDFSGIVHEVSAGGSGVIVMADDDVYSAGHDYAVVGQASKILVAAGIGPCRYIGSGKFQQFAGCNILYGWGLNGACQLADIEPTTVDTPISITDLGGLDLDGNWEIGIGDGIVSLQILTSSKTISRCASMEQVGLQQTLQILQDVSK